MNRRRRFLKCVTCGLLALAGLASAPATAPAGWLGFRNETHSPVVVQISHVTKTGVQHGKTHLLNQNNVTWERILQPGNKLITIYDPTQPRRILFSGPLAYAGNDLFFAIQAEQAPAGAPVPLSAGSPKLKLVPTKP